MFIIYPLGKCITLSLHHFADIGNDSSIRHFCTLIYIVAVFRNSQKMIVGYDKSFVLIQELNYWRSFSISLDSAPLLFIEKSFSHSCRRISAVYIHIFFHTHTHTLAHAHTATHKHIETNKQRCLTEHLPSSFFVQFIRNSKKYLWHMVSIFSTPYVTDNMHLSKTAYGPTCSLLLDNSSKKMNKNTYF